MKHHASYEQPVSMSDDGVIDLLRAAVADDIANLISRLPVGAGFLEMSMTDGRDTGELADVLASLPDGDDLVALDASLNNPDALANLLSSRDSAAAHVHRAATAAW